MNIKRAHDQQSGKTFYAYFDSPRTFKEADELCQRLTGHLLTIKNRGENLFALELIPKDKLERTQREVFLTKAKIEHIYYIYTLFLRKVWLGLRSRTHWRDGSGVHYSKWLNDEKEDLSCFALTRSWEGYWEPRSCDSKAWTICEIDKYVK